MLKKTAKYLGLWAGIGAASALSLLPASSAWAETKPVTVGFVYVGSREDYGYNQSHAEGAAAVRSMPGVKVLEEENVPETLNIVKTMESMIKLDGASIIFPTSYGYFNPHVVKTAPKFPQATFFHCGGLFEEGKTPANIGTYFGYIDECEYISGVVAGYASKSGKLGFIAAKPIPQVLRNINAFTLGAKSVNPAITTTVIFTGDWFLPVKEAEAANSLIDQGIDVLTCHVDSPKVIIQTSEKRGVWSCGYHANGFPLAPKGYLTGSEWNWSTVYTSYVKAVQSGATWDHSVRGGLKEGFVKLSAFGPAVSPEAKKAAMDLQEKFLAGGMVIFKGPLKDNTGKELYKDGEMHVQTDPTLEAMNYLVEGIIGKITWN